MTAADIVVLQGNSDPVAGWLFPFDIRGSEFVLTITWRDGSLTKSTADGGLVISSTVVDGETVPVVFWTPTLAETRQIPKGRVASYELERRVPGGERRTYAAGMVTGAQVQDSMVVEVITIEGVKVICVR